VDFQPGRRRLRSSPVRRPGIDDLSRNL
jgi:hypothetical protein